MTIDGTKQRSATDRFAAPLGSRVRPPVKLRLAMNRCMTEQRAGSSSREGARGQLQEGRRIAMELRYGPDGSFQNIAASACESALLGTRLRRTPTCRRHDPGINPRGGLTATIREPRAVDCAHWVLDPTIGGTPARTGRRRCVASRGSRGRVAADLISQLLRNSARDCDLNAYQVARQRATLPVHEVLEDCKRIGFRRVHHLVARTDPAAAPAVRAGSIGRRIPGADDPVCVFYVLKLGGHAGPARSPPRPRARSSGVPASARVAIRWIPRSANWTASSWTSLTGVREWAAR